jgi:hypothetical protein
VGSGPFEAQRLSINRVNQNPIGLYMTIARAAPFAPQRMVAMPRIKWPAFRKNSHNVFHFGNIFASLSHSLDVSQKLIRLRKRSHFFQLANISSSESNG